MGRPFEGVKLRTVPPSSPACPAQGHHVALPRPSDHSGQSRVPMLHPTPPAHQLPRPLSGVELGGCQAGKLGGKMKKNQPSNGTATWAWGLPHFSFKLLRNSRCLELGQAGETLRSLSRRDERGNRGLLIIAQVGPREADLLRKMKFISSIRLRVWHIVSSKLSSKLQL